LGEDVSPGGKKHRRWEWKEGDGILPKGGGWVLAWTGHETKDKW